MSFTATKDTQTADSYIDISKTDKRLIRATVKTYDKTGSYVFLKLFKKPEINSDDYKFEQRIGLTIDEFHKLTQKSIKVNALVPQKNDSDSSDSECCKEEEESKPPAAKRPRKLPAQKTKPVE